ncbi:MAG: CRISPR pre-crRNA endoribonuclease Cas5d [Dehalococcoidia bacterium]|nr:CRISPR pre-crRNA endoribonuclease Cas5d [Chloroflexota bacterium]
MNTTDNRITIRVWGDYACFTRPEMKVERVSYPLCTPSAARGILEAIYWEPQMYYVIDNIAVVKKGRWFSFRRNEVSSVINIDQAKSWMLGKTPVKYIAAGGGAADAAQRNMLALMDVEYLITAEVRTTRRHDASRFTIKKYLCAIQRRASNGKCCHRPVLGCREFAADFDWVEDPAKINLVEWREEDLGLMLYDIFDVDQRAEGFRWLSSEELTNAEITREAKIENMPISQRKVAAKKPLQHYEGKVIQPQGAFFHAKIQDARMECHPERITILRPGAKEVN